MIITAPWAGATLPGAFATALGVAVVAYCVLGEPFVGRWLHHRMAEEVTRDASRRARGYHRLLILELALGAGALLVALALPGIGAAHLGLAPPLGSGSAVLLGAGLGTSLVLLAGVVLSTVAIWRLQQPIPVVGGDRVRVMVPGRAPERVEFVLLALAAGVCEELLYRGLLFAVLGALLPALSPWLIVVLGAIAFGAAHAYQGRTGILVTTLLGALLGAIYLTTGSIFLVMFLHALLDARVGLLPRRALAPEPAGTGA